MSSIQPTPSNDYTWLRETLLNPETLNLVFGSISARLKAQEAKVADYEAAIAQLTDLGLATIAENLAPAIEASRLQLVALEEQAALLADEIAAIRAGVVDATSVVVAPISGLAATRAQAAIAELLGRINAADQALVDAVENIDAAFAAVNLALAGKAPVNGPTFTGTVTLPDGTQIGPTKPLSYPLWRLERTANTQLTKNDSGKLVDVVSGTFSQTFEAATTLGAGWWCALANTGSGVVTLDPNGAETIDGAATRIMNGGDIRWVVCDGTSFRTFVLALAPQEMHVVDEKPMGQRGGDPSGLANQYITRTLNTVRRNTIPGASLAGNQITLPAGTYEIIALSPAHGGGSTAARIYNVTTSTTLISGAEDGSGQSPQHVLVGYITLPAQQAIRLECRYSIMSSSNSNIMGGPSGGGMAETYGQVRIRRMLG